MTPSVLHRAWRGARRIWSWCAVPLRWVTRAVRSTDAAPTDERGWELDRPRRTETRWRRDGETVRCFRFDDGYVSTVEYDDRGVTWQLTPGQVPLASALAMATVYRHHGTTPQIDLEGRPFVAVGESGPRQVFEEIADEPVDYVYLDTVRTLEEFPSFIDVTDEVRRVYERMSPTRYSTMG